MGKLYPQHPPGVEIMSSLSCVYVFEVGQAVVGEAPCGPPQGKSSTPRVFHLAGG